jgi:hypothetical protein
MYQQHHQYLKAMANNGDNGESSGWRDGGVGSAKRGGLAKANGGLNQSLSGGISIQWRL